MCENVNLPSRAPVVASPEGLTGSTTQVYKMDEICEQCRIQLMLRQRRACFLFWHVTCNIKIHICCFKPGNFSMFHISN